MGILKKIKTYKNELLALTRENYWANVFNSTINGSVWLKDPSFSPGRWAAGYPLLYVLYRILNEVKPASILELGLGQTTRMTAQYINHLNTNAQQRIVEHDDNWIGFFSNNFDLTSRNEIVKLDIETVIYKNNNVTRYKEFRKLSDRKYDLIVIDAPFGSKEYSRIDILDILPDALAEDFIILFDDFERSGEKRSAELLEKKLSESSIKYKKGFYCGNKDVIVIVSEKNSFITSM